MAKFKLVISNATGMSKCVEIEGAKASPLIGRRIGEIIDGSIVGVAGLKLKITGGSDKDGFPLKPGVHGGGRKAILIGRGIGIRKGGKGQRRRKVVHGNIITANVVQVNLKTLQK